MARHAPGPAAGEQREAILQAGQHLRRGQHLRARGRQFHGQGQALQAGAEGGDGRGIVRA